MLWSDGSVPFPFGKTAPAYLPTALSVALRPLLPFQQAQYCSSFSAEACAILHALCWSWQHHQVCHFSSFFLLYDSSTVLTTLSSPPSFLLPQTFWQIWQKLSSFSPVLSGYNGFPDTRFSRGTTRLMSWPDGERYLRPLQSLVVSLLLSLVSTRVFSRTGGVQSHRNSSTHRLPRFFTEKLVLPRHARCVLSRLRCNEHSFLLSSYLSRIDRIENPSCSARGHTSQDTSHLNLHCPATDCLRRSHFGDSLSLCDFWSRPLGVARLLGLHGLSPCPHPLGRVRVTTTTKFICTFYVIRALST